MKRLVLGAVAAFSLVAGAAAQSPTPTGEAKAANPTQAVAIFAGGCFWCVESDFDKVAGVVRTTSGYIGGKEKNPTYRQVAGGDTGHAEAVEIVYDPAKVTYQQLLDVYWRSVDPLTKDAQFCDRGRQYRTAIFYTAPDQKRLADASKSKVQAHFGKPVYTEIVPAGVFYKAEDYHQDYYEKNPVRYKFYRWNCGRDQRLEQIWGAKQG